MYKEYKRFTGIATPFYYYDLDLLRDTLDTLNREAGKYNYKVHYALKANADSQVLQIIRDAGLGADCVSGNEVQKSLNIGFPAKDIYYAGVGKTDDEIRTGLAGNIGCFNCESVQEITVMNQIASDMNMVAKIALRINPDINSNTHSYITTGIQENKFGIQLWELDEVLSVIRQLKNINLIGLHFHIGSQIIRLEIFRKLCLKVNEINDWFIERKYFLPVLNLGGGLGIDYHDPDSNPVPDFRNYFKTVYDTLLPQPWQEIHFELGRSVVGQMGSLISKVLYIKNGKTKNFAIMDSGMTELIRPALYHSFHKIVNLYKSNLNGTFLPYLKYDVVGPVCETTDFLGKEVELPRTERGDLFAICSVGAYGQSMASNYNLRERAGVTYSDDLSG